MVEATKTPEMTKRAKWEKIKKELLKLPKRYPKIKEIAISHELEAIILIVDPVSVSYELNLYREARILELDYGVNYAGFDIINLDNFPGGYSVKELFGSKFKMIYERL